MNNAIGYRRGSMINRRSWLSTTVEGLGYLACSMGAAEGQTGAPPVLKGRILQVIHGYEKQGFHRTGTKVDHASGSWLRDQVRRTGLAASLEAFSLQRVDPVLASLIASERRIEGIPLFDGGFTDENGIRGQLGSLDSGTPVGLTEAIPYAAAAGALGDARRKNRHKAIVCVTRGGRPGLCPSNADSFLHPFGPPVQQVSSEHASWLEECVA